MNSCSYGFEMQLLLHPNFKNPVGALKKVILMSNLQAGASQQVADRHFIKVRRKIIDGVRRIMEAVDTQPTPPGIVAPPPVAVFSRYLMELFAETANEVAPPPVDTHTAMHQQRIDEELDRWLSTPTSLKVIRPGEFEPS
ncbi:Apurinic endonuclease-redox protein [Phytophthora nicotianae]|uniref:Apurinic endonuclease-redox protein n=1 Tax=Phytophthora nicotianae TaxID=4792 RepID=A0A0W8CCQ4_PHYNI|nr:Apurinic endonuclease-redox protein [Phytophthora nicotianae]